MRLIQGWYSFGQLCLSFVIWLIISSLLSCECIQLSLFRLWDLEIYLVLDLLDQDSCAPANQLFLTARSTFSVLQRTRADRPSGAAAGCLAVAA
jgi:hypothetical protein